MPSLSNPTQIQFKVTPTQVTQLDQNRPPTMSIDQYAKWLLLISIDEDAADIMHTNATNGRKRTTN